MTNRCPLCGEECKTAAHVRQHLHVNHRKSALIDAYIEDHEDVEGQRPMPAK